MGHERRLSIIQFLQKNPGKNGGDIARALGFSNGVNIQGDMVFLRTHGIIRREGEGTAARWSAVADKEVIAPEKRGRKKGYHAHKNICAYHRENARSGPQMCMRCIDVGMKEVKRSDALLRKLFPRIFAVGDRA